MMELTVHIEHLHLNVHHLDAAALAEVQRKLDHLIERNHHMAGELQRITAAVTLIKGKADSLIALTTGLAKFIRDNLGNTTALADLATQLETEAASVQAAIDANPLPGDSGGGTPIALPAGVAGQAYSANLVASFKTPGGIAPFSYTLTSGALPPDMTLDLSNGNLANNERTVATAGDYSFTVQRQDSDAATVDESETFSLHIA
jgi:hypothetical protein